MLAKLALVVGAHDVQKAQLRYIHVPLVYICLERRLDLPGTLALCGGEGVRTRQSGSNPLASVCSVAKSQLYVVSLDGNFPKSANYRKRSWPWGPCSYICVVVVDHETSLCSRVAVDCWKNLGQDRKGTKCWKTLAENDRDINKMRQKWKS